ncbi:hypothetical protein V1509DRAFT_630756 [Lipomyces kononenkoae]
MVYSGMGPDFRVLVGKARKSSHTNYKRIFEQYPPARIVVQDVAPTMREATQSGGGSSSLASRSYSSLDSSID